MTILIIDRRGKQHEISAQPGWSLMEALCEAGLPVAAICGGAKSCGTCHVYVSEETYRALPEPQADELELLEESGHLRPGASRLSCQVRIDELRGDATIVLAPDRP